MLILLKAGSNWKKYFINRRTLLTNGFFGSLFVSFVKITGYETAQHIANRCISEPAYNTHLLVTFVRFRSLTQVQW
jgi:hypothetical protein